MDESNNLIESKWSHTDVSDLTGKKFYVCTSTIQEPFITSRYNLIPCPSTGPKMFCAFPNILSQSKNLIAFSASSKTFVPAQKPNLLNGNHLLVRYKIFGIGTKCISIFGLAKNILERVSS